MITFRSVDSARQCWEDEVNRSFVRIRSTERVCWHADVTVKVSRGLVRSECDYCPALFISAVEEGPKIPVPFYYRDDGS